MADVSRPIRPIGPIGIAGQILLVAGLRWRILRNTLRRKQNRLDLIGLIVTSLLAAAFVISLCFAFFSGTYSFLLTGKAAWMGLLFWGIFVWWQIFPIFVAAFGASFGFRTLLRFPLNLSAFYLIGLAYGLADFTALASLCWLGSIVAGAVAAAPNVVPAMLLASALFVLLNVTLERLTGSWFERLLAQRRTRELFFAIFILLMISVQLIGPFLNRYGDAAAPWAIRLLPYLSFLPPALVGKVIVAAVTKDLRGVFLNLGGLCLYVVLFSALLWRRFASEYSGEELSETPRPARAIRTIAKPQQLGDTLRLLSPQLVAVISKEFRYLMRNGFAALLLLLPPLLVFVLISQSTLVHFAGGSSSIPSDAFFPGLMAYIILVLMAPTYNSFAYESAGVQTYFTAPLHFRNIFLGKNFVHVCLVLTELVLCIVAFSYRVGLPSSPIFFATLAAIVFTVIGQLSIANWSSLSFPRKLAFGQMHGQRQSGMAVLVAFGAQILLFGISSVILLLGRWTGDPWLPTEAFVLLAAAALAGYVASLDPLAQFAEKKKETLINALCR